MKILLISCLIFASQCSILPQEQLCSYNSIGFVPASPIHNYSVINQPGDETPYSGDDFQVTWEEVQRKRHRFFRKIQRGYANKKQTLEKMSCKVSGKQQLQRVCDISENEIDQYYHNAFGQQSSFSCSVPENHFAIFLRFVLKLSDFDTSAGGRWSIFVGLYQYQSIDQAKLIIQEEGEKLSRAINKTKLDTFDINSNLNIIPQFVQGSLSWVFNSNRESEYVQNIELNTPYDLTDQGFIKVIPSGTQFIMGNIYNGTQQIKQTCDRFWIEDEDDCGFDFGGPKQHRRHRHRRLKGWY